MCGIAGKATRGQGVDPVLLERMCEVIEHRGPDSRGAFADDGVGLGIQRLRIIDLETGDQPIYNEDGSVVVVLNGEIYNYRELRSELESAGHRFSTRTDTEVIVHLYEDLGEACVERMRGMFAFALWDRRRRSLLLARDRLGKKPLFYADRDGCLWFASEARSILQDPEIPRDVDYEAIDAFLQYGYVPHPLSAFAALRKLPPAHTLTWSDGRVTTRRYWKLSYRDSARGLAPGEAEELVRHHLLEATRLRMRSDVPLGAFLSGGVDSTAVVAAMARQASGRVSTFSIGFDVGEFDETPYAREVAELFDTDHHEFRVEPEAMEVLPKLVWHYGEPFADPSAIPSFYLAELARSRVTVALNGDGGDESFAGYSRYYVHQFAHRLGWTPRPVARAAAALLDRTSAQRSRHRPVRSLWWLSHALSMPPHEKYEETLSNFTRDERRALYTADLRDRLGGLEHPWQSAAVHELFDASDAETFIERLLDVDVSFYLPGDLLVKMDIATMAHSLEVRSPLLDHVFMEMAAGLPAEAKLRGATSKRVLKDALRPWVPDHILDRRKMGFNVPLAEWFRGRLRELPSEVLLDRRSVERGLFSEDRVRALIDDHLARRRDNADKLWALLQLELWFRTYVDSPVGAPLALGAA